MQSHTGMHDRVSIFNLVPKEDSKERKDTLVGDLGSVSCSTLWICSPFLGPSFNPRLPLAILEPPLVRLVLRKGMRRLLGESLQSMMEKSFLIRKEYNSLQSF